MNNQQLLRYSRHILLNEIDIEGQEKLINSSICVIGCGGLGSAVLPYLVSSGVGKIFIADNDVIEISNLQRQICFNDTHLGQSKALTMKQFLNQLNPECEIIALNQYLYLNDLKELFSQCDVIVDCSDNFATRQAINTASVWTQKPLVSGSAVRFDGQISVYLPDFYQENKNPCYHCLFDLEESNDGACAIFGVFAPLVGVIGSMQAVETLKIILNQNLNNINNNIKTGLLRCYNALSGQWQEFHFHKNPHCPICSKIPSQLPK